VGCVLRLVLSPRWIMWHVLTIGAMVTCGLLSAWQWQRAGSAMGSALNVGYGLQWPVFALFFGLMWFRMLRLEIGRLPRTPDMAVDADSPPAPPAGTTPFARPNADVPPITDETDPELAAYNRMLAVLAARDAAENG